MSDSSSKKIPAPILMMIGIAAALAVMIGISGNGSTTTSTTPLRRQSNAGAAPDTSAAASTRLAASAGAEPPIGEFYYLIDVSASTKAASRASAFDEGIALLEPIFDALRQIDELSPQRHRVSTIGSLSLGPSPLCDVYVAKATLFTPDNGAPQRTMRACVRALRSAPAEKFTDIGGALVNAGLSIRGQRPAMRGIVLVSDLEEDVPPGTVASRPDLRETCIAVYTLVTPQSAHDPSILARNAHEWEKKLRADGARAVYVANARGFDDADLSNFFRRCES